MKLITNDEMSLWLSFSESRCLTMYKSVHNRKPVQAPMSPTNDVVGLKTSGVRRGSREGRN